MVTANFGDIDMSKIAGMSGKGEYLQMMKRLMVCVLLLALITLQGCQRIEINNAKEVSGEPSTREDSQNQETADDTALELDMEESLETEPLGKEPESALESWVGVYKYWETFPDDIQEDLNFYIRYTVRIYEENGAYYGDISSWSDQIHSESLARIEGDEDAIDFLFVETLPKDKGYYGWAERYEKDTLLLSFSRDGGTLQTNWEALRLETPYFADRKDDISGEYFEKIDIDEEANGNLSSWIGVYRYEASFPSDSEEEDMITYTVNIYEENDVYYADVAGRGQQLYSESLSYIQGDENAIDFFFMETLSEDAHFWRDERYDLNGLLLSFSRKDGKIQTSWGQLRREHPVFADSGEKITGEYFKKTDMNNSGGETGGETSNGENKGNDLSTWVGSYAYSEAARHPTNEGYYHTMVLQMKIYEEEGEYYANISGDGWMLCTRILARIEGDENKIDFFFMETLPEDISLLYGGEIYEKDEQLLSFSRKEDIIQTSWGALRLETLFLSSCEGEVVGEYFKRTD